MKILHYGLGYSPERTGGLVQYVTDLMKEQVKQGNEVFYLFPGKVDFFKSATRIKKGKMRIAGIKSFELINSLPLAVFGGVKEPEKFCKKVNRAIYENLFSEIMPDIIHVHSLMGLHREFFEVASDKKIKIVYTSHDYFGLSPNPTFYFNGKSWDESNTLNYWLNVSQGAMTVAKLKVLQLSFYPKLRDFIKKFKKTSFQREQHSPIKANNEFSEEFRQSFENLRQYYQSIFNLIDFFHYNSSVAKEVFEKNLGQTSRHFEVLPLTNSTVKGGKKYIELDMSQVNKITYIGQYAEFKGFDDFIDLASKNPKLQFEIYGENIDVQLPKNVDNRKRFSAKNRKVVFENIELLIVPSEWKETFGFLALEALDNNCPVLVSANVGAKDLISDDFIVETELTNTINKLLGQIYELKVSLLNISEHLMLIDNLYKKVKE